MKAIVLAAGKGTRLRPLTDFRPKHLMEIAGIPLLNRILSPLISSSLITEISIVLHYKAEQIKKAVSAWFPNHSISYIHQESTLGTGDAVDAAIRAMDPDETFVVVNGDILIGDPLSDVISSFDSTSHDGLILGYLSSDPSAFGVISHDNYRLTGLVEKPDVPPPSSLINAGLYIFPKEAKNYFKNLTESERGERELTDVIQAMLKDKYSFQVQPISTTWFDIGHPWQILDANEYFMDAESSNYAIEGQVEPGVHIHGDVRVAPTAKVRSGTYIEGPVYIDEGADIGPNSYLRGRTYLGRNTRIGNACEIKNSLIYHGSHVAHLSYVGDSVIGRNCNFGAGTITANLRHDGDNIKLHVKDKRMDSGRRKLGVITGDNVKTGIGVDLLPGVKLSSGTWLNAGEVVSRDR